MRAIVAMLVAWLTFAPVAAAVSAGKSYDEAYDLLFTSHATARVEALLVSFDPLGAGCVFRVTATGVAESSFSPLSGFYWWSIGHRQSEDTVQGSFSESNQESWTVVVPVGAVGDAVYDASVSWYGTDGALSSGTSAHAWTKLVCAPV